MKELEKQMKAEDMLTREEDSKEFDKDKTS